MGRITTGRVAMGALALLLLAGLSACGRNKYPLTACVGDQPAVERTMDVAPPNCPDT
jgi:hypothetical protein